MNKDSEEALLRDVDIIHRQLEHEDDLMVNRLSWLVASQSFLFTAYAIVLNGTLTVRNVVFSRRQDILMHIVPELGLATCGLIYLGVLAGIYVTVALRHDVKKHSTAATGLRLLQGTQATHALGLAAPLFLPPLFFVAWVVLLTD